MFSATHFVAGGGRKGKYVETTGKVLRIDPVERTLTIEEKKPDTTGEKIEKALPTVIRFDDLTDISGVKIVDIDEYLGIDPLYTGEETVVGNK